MYETGEHNHASRIGTSRSVKFQAECWVTRGPMTSRRGEVRFHTYKKLVKTAVAHSEKTVYNHTHERRQHMGTTWDAHARVSGHIRTGDDERFPEIEATSRGLRHVSGRHRGAPGAFRTVARWSTRARLQTSNSMNRIKALQHLIWQEQNKQLFKPKLFNRKRLNRLIRELRELGGKTYDEEWDQDTQAGAVHQEPPASPQEQNTAPPPEASRLGWLVSTHLK